MEENVGELDSKFRTVGGAVLGFLALNAMVDRCVADLYAPFFGAWSLFLLYTGLTRKCGCNRLLGLDTTKFDSEED